jgi:hypothetical protein
MKPMESERKNSNLNALWWNIIYNGAKTLRKQFVVCIKNDKYPASLELMKIYQIIPSSYADEHDLILVIDESGEDYFYPADYFALIDLPKAVEEVLTYAT